MGRELRDENGAVPFFTYRGTMIPCVPSMASMSGQLEPGGLGMEQGVRFAVSITDMARPPRIKDVLVHRGSQYSVDSVSLSPDGGYFKIECVRYGRGA